MKTRQQFFKEYWWVNLLITIPMFIALVIALTSFFEIWNNITISSLFSICFYFISMNTSYLDYMSDEFNKLNERIKKLENESKTKS